MKYYPALEDVTKAHHRLKNVVNTSPLLSNLNLSAKFDSNILLKREDLQIVRSYKIRGAYNKIASLNEKQIYSGIVCASAGNHAQGVAYSCSLLKIKGVVYMPETTPKQKIEQVKMFGKEFIDIVLTGDTFDAANGRALQYAVENDKTFIHPFDDPKIIEGQATIGLEILSGFRENIDYLFLPIGGGGLASGVGSVFKHLSPSTKIIGVEPMGAQSMKSSIDANEIIELRQIDRFIDGAAVKRVGEHTFNICKKVLDKIIPVPEGAVCSTILDLYNKNAIVVEPAGALAISALEFCSGEIKGKNVVCIVSGSNNDISRTEEIRERALLYEGLKHYFVIRFPQRSGALLAFIKNVLGPEDDITHFSYSKRTNREQGPALIGIELSKRDDLGELLERMKKNSVTYEYINNKEDLFGVLI